MPTRLSRLNNLILNASPLVQRLATGALVGLTHRGERDIYRAAGYKETLAFADYLAAYARHDVARRIVRALPDETWRFAPDVLDGADAAQSSDKTPFAVEWKRVAGELGPPDDAEAGKGLLHYLHRVDRVSGIGRYGVLFFGLRDGQELREPVEPGSLQPGDLLYASVFDEGAAQIDSLDEDPQSPRFGLPLLYRLHVGGGAGSDTALVHWTRCLHVVEDTDGDEVYGRPRLEAVWNRLTDLLKILAASGEAAWKLLDSGLIIRTTDGATLPASEDALADLEDQVDEFVHGLRRWLLAEGIEGQPLGGSVADPSGLFDINMTLIAAATGIPKRILLGSERGELASTQDEDSWERLVETRQQNYAGPQLVRAAVRRLIWAGVLPQPASGDFCIRWPGMVTRNMLAEAQTAHVAAQALAALGVTVAPDVFLGEYLPDIARGYMPTPGSVPQPTQPPQEGQGGEAAAGGKGGEAAPHRAARFPAWALTPNGGSDGRDGWTAYP